MTKGRVSRIRGKYNAKKTIINGIKFDSQLEANCYLILKDKKDLVLQPKFLLQPSFKKGKKTHRRIEYIADFQFSHNGQILVIDAKGMKTEVFKIKEKLLLYKYPELNFYTVKSARELLLLLSLHYEKLT